MMMRLLYKYSQQAIPYIPQEKFIGEASLLLYRIENSFNKLKEFEPRIQIQNEANTLIVRIKDFGDYNFTVNLKDRQVCFQSPFQIHSYFYNEKEDQWVNLKDSHLLIECLTRETGKYLKGYLEF